MEKISFPAIKAAPDGTCAAVCLRRDGIAAVKGVLPNEDLPNGCGDDTPIRPPDMRERTAHELDTATFPEACRTRAWLS